MNFADRIKEQAQAQDTSEKQITREEFNEALKTVSLETLEEYEGGALIAITGITFCNHMKEFMFEGKEKCTEEEFARAIEYAFEKFPENLTGAAAFLAPMVGMIFAEKAKDILFKRQED